jgi:hypothetical protein
MSKKRTHRSGKPVGRAGVSHVVATPLTWAAMIKKVYEVDPLKCPKCSWQMRIISFLEKKDQADVIEKILKHCKLWVEPEERAPPEKAVLIPFESVHVPIDEFLASF